MVQETIQSVARLLGSSGRILVRESGTEPVIRVMVEAEDRDFCRSCVNQVVQAIRLQGHEQ